jgi:hypothetical protein
MDDIVPNGNGQHGGGLGERRATPRSNADARLVERAVREHWPIKSKHRALAVDTLVSVMSDPNATNRERVGAARALGTLGKANSDACRSVAFVKRFQPDAKLDAAREVGITLREYLEETHRLAAFEKEAAERMRDDLSTDGMYQP